MVDGLDRALWAHLPYRPGQLMHGDLVAKALVGVGGFGAVYLAQDASGELVAVKVLHRRSGLTVSQLQAFQREALTGLKLGTHEFIVQVLEVHEPGDRLLVVMEYVAPTDDCVTLEDHISHCSSYSDYEIAMWSIQFCVAMAHAQSCGVQAHRDIKPTNLMVTPDGFLKVGDFGLAVAAASAQPQAEAQFGKGLRTGIALDAHGHTTIGTPGFMAPELSQGGRASVQSDMYSFGICLWQLAARNNGSPYGVIFAGDVQAYHAQTTKKALAATYQRLGSMFDPVIARCLHPDPKQRYASYPELREAIKGTLKAAGDRVIDFLVAPGFRGTFSELVNRGVSLAVLGEYDHALAVLNQAVTHRPDSYEGLCARAEVLMLRNPRAALQDLKFAAALKPGAQRACLGTVRALRRLGHRSEALSAVDKILKTEPKAVPILLEKALLLGAMGRNRDAHSLVRSALALQPGNPTALEYHGRALAAAGNTVGALAAYQTALAARPLSVDLHLAVVSLLKSTGTNTRATHALEEICELFAEDLDALNRVAVYMSENGFEELAILLFNSLGERSPASRANMLVNIGSAYRNLGKPQPARDAYTRAADADPMFALAWRKRADLEFAEGDMTMAASLYAKACELQPEDFEAHFGAGTALLNLKGHAAALAYLRKAAAIDPSNSACSLNIAATLAKQGDLASSLTEICRLTSAMPDYARAWLLRAQIESMLSKLADARQSAGKAIDLAAGLTQIEVERARSLL